MCCNFHLPAKEEYPRKKNHLGKIHIVGGIWRLQEGAPRLFKDGGKTLLASEFCPTEKVVNGRMKPFFLFSP